MCVERRREGEREKGVLDEGGNGVIEGEREIGFRVGEISRDGVGEGEFEEENEEPLEESDEAVDKESDGASSDAGSVSDSLRDNKLEMRIFSKPSFRGPFSMAPLITSPSCQRRPTERKAATMKRPGTLRRAGVCVVSLWLKITGCLGTLERNF